MNENLLEKHSSDERFFKSIKHINYNICFLIAIGAAYSVLFVTMAININTMTINLNQIIDLMDKIESNQINTTLINNMRDEFIQISDCFINKYCRHIH